MQISFQTKHVMTSDHSEPIKVQQSKPQNNKPESKGPCQSQLERRHPPDPDPTKRNRETRETNLNAKSSYGKHVVYDYNHSSPSANQPPKPQRITK